MRASLFFFGAAETTFLICDLISGDGGPLCNASLADDSLGDTLAVYSIGVLSSGRSLSAK